MKPDQSPVVVKKVEPVLAEHKLQDGAAPVAIPPAPTTSTGSGRRKSKKQKVEAAVTGMTGPSEGEGAGLKLDKQVKRSKTLRKC